ncbi:N-acetylmuramoyl-L-alanine amidase family protein [Neobacillus cucumis]|uniref:N-acetylmuramoyl-L-alanine amidase family protein n=1 Tax=Neobacillus cucumis TaxID=1740721 RepID=UPI001962A660|nr:N-acetylmuramoyl-L-alanine amidase [Neobacillus cucumis]MBM7652555.1 N-acetylmuramoyl-L-alanine amidase [Neobacillus cucumis]
MTSKKLFFILVGLGVLFVSLLVFYINNKQEAPKEQPIVKKTEQGGQTKNTAEKKPTPVTEQPQPKSQPAKKSFVVCIDPGHQRKADLATEPVGPGARTEKIKVTGGTTGLSTGKPEYILNLEASLILGKILKQRGYEVVYTRTTHDVNLSNIQRAEIANQHHADLFIRIHADGSTNRNTSGFSILTTSSKNPYTQAIYQDSLQAGESILAAVKGSGETKVNGISYRDDMSGLNWAKVPAILIEMGFMTNPKEDQNLSNGDYLQKLMMEVSDGIDEYTKQ